MDSEARMWSIIVSVVAVSLAAFGVKACEYNIANERIQAEVTRSQNDLAIQQAAYAADRMKACIDSGATWLNESCLQCQPRPVPTNETKP